MNREELIEDGSSIRHKGNGALIGRVIGKNYLPCILIALTFNASSLVDSMLAGYFFAPICIAAVGVVTPINTLCISVLMLVVQGTYSTYTTALGRGQRHVCRQIFTVGVLRILVWGTLLSVFCILFADRLTELFGGSIFGFASTYLKYTAFTCPALALTRLITLMMGVYGHQKYGFYAIITFLVSNVLFSIGCIKLFPKAELGDLGLGTLLAVVPTLLFCLYSIKKHRLPIRLELKKEAFSKERFRDMFLCGISVSSNSAIDALVTGFINNIITASALGAQGLTFFAVASNFWHLAAVPAEGMDYANAPMVGICYASKNKSGLKNSIQTGIREAILSTALWVIVLFLFTPLLLKIYLGSSAAVPAAAALARRAIHITLLFAPLYPIIYLLAAFFDSTENLKYSMFLSIVPDSVILPLMVWLLLPSLGYTGLWLALGGYTPVSLLLFVLPIFLRKRSRVSADDLLILGKGACAEYPAVDVTLYYSDEDISELTEKVQHFLKQEHASSRTSYLTALCLDELATDIVARARKKNTRATPADRMIDVKVVAEEDYFNLILFNISGPYNPLDFDYTNEDFSKVGLMMVQKIAKKISYNYIYNANLIMITIAK